MDAVHSFVDHAIKTELDVANTHFPAFNSPHEGYAVILEEMDETQTALICGKITLEEAWDKIKANEDATKVMFELRKKMLETACEAIQTAAMAEKYMQASGRGFKIATDDKNAARSALATIESFCKATGDKVIGHRDINGGASFNLLSDENEGRNE